MRFLMGGMNIIKKTSCICPGNTCLRTKTSKEKLIIQFPPRQARIHVLLCLSLSLSLPRPRALVALLGLLLQCRNAKPSSSPTLGVSLLLLEIFSLSNVSSANRNNNRERAVWRKEREREKENLSTHLRDFPRLSSLLSCTLRPVVLGLAMLLTFLARNEML